MNPYISKVLSAPGLSRREFFATGGMGLAGVCVLVPLLGMAVAARSEEAATAPAVSVGSPAFTLPALPYAQKALEPYISARTMGFHYAKHHKAYVDNLNNLVAGTPWAAGRTLER